MTLPQRIKRKSDKADQGKRSPAHRHIANPFLRIQSLVDPIDFSAWIGSWDGCWLWDGGLNERGYGYFCVGGGKITAHRAAYLLWKGPICGGLHVLHSCDVRNCVNPKHLRLGTHADNMRDMVVKGRNYVARGERAPSARLTQQQVLEIRRSNAAGTDLAQEMGVSKSTIYAIRNGLTWKGLQDAAA